MAALQALRRLSLGRNEPVYLVGGPVRDALLRRSAKDLDFAVEGDAPGLAALLADEVKGHLAVHQRFGTASVFTGSFAVDLATARREVYPAPAALPQVFPAGILEDLARRDFSINAMAAPLCQDSRDLLDPCGGEEDLRLGSVRTLHARSFSDDPTRIFRAVRYEQRLGFKLEEETLEQLRHALSEGRVGGLTGDRVRHELERMFKEADPGPALTRAMELGILTAVHPPLAGEDVIARLGLLSEYSRSTGRPLGPLVWLSALSHHLNESQGQFLAQRLNMPRAWRLAVRGSVYLRENLPHLKVPPLSNSSLVRLLEGHSGESILAMSVFHESETVRGRLTWYLEALRNVSVDVGGGDLQSLGVDPGPEMGRILDLVRQAKLDGAVSTKSEQLQMARDILARRRGSLICREEAAGAGEAP